MHSVNTKIIQGFILHKKVVETEIVDGKEVPKVLLAVIVTTDMIWEDDKVVDLENRHFVRFEGHSARTVNKFEDGTGLGVQGMDISKCVMKDNGEFSHWFVELLAEKIWLPREHIQVTKVGE